jgi:hypothetical protein
MRFACSFAPFARVEGGEMCVAFEVGVDLGELQAVGQG